MSTELTINSWTRQIGSSAYEWATPLTTGVDGAIYMAGSTLGSLDGQQNLGNADAFITKYSPDGSKAWTRLLGSDLNDWANALTTGADGAIYMAGTTYGVLDGQVNLGSAQGKGDAFLVKYNPDGSKAWTRLIGSANSVAYALTTGADGSIYMAGGTLDSLDGQTYAGGGSDAFLTKYNPDGSKAWTQQLGSAYFDRATALTTGIDGAVYMAGTTYGPLDGQVALTNGDAFLTRYNSDGTKAWTQLLATGYNDQATALATGLDGAIYMTGYTYGSLGGQASAGNYDTFLSKFNSDGSKAWTQQFGSNSPDHASALTLGANGAIYTAGYTYSGVGGADSFLTRYNADGRYAWTRIYGSNLSDKANALTMGVDGVIYTAGNVGDSVFLKKLFIIDVAASENVKFVCNLKFDDPLLGTSHRLTLSGKDVELFRVSSKGVVTFVAGQDYEKPLDFGLDNIYELTVTATNSKTGYSVSAELFTGIVFTPLLGGEANDLIKGGKTWDTLDGLGGDDKLTGGNGLDTFIVSAGRDTITDFNQLGKDVWGMEVLQVLIGAEAIANVRLPWMATASSYNSGTATLLSSGQDIDLSAINEGKGWTLTNKGKGVLFIGSQFDDVLVGATGVDNFYGNAGNDLLVGGKGSDFLTGGEGEDTFRLSGDTKTDHITDFWSGEDRIELDNLVFKAMLTEGQLAAVQFAQGTVATTATQRILYDQPTGNLWYDVDGSGKKAAVLMAVLDNQVEIAHTDFWVI
jgi:uncharacterized delta-60 repeat protein